MIPGDEINFRRSRQNQRILYNTPADSIIFPYRGHLPFRRKSNYSCLFTDTVFTARHVNHLYRCFLFLRNPTCVYTAKYNNGQVAHVRVVRMIIAFDRSDLKTIIPTETTRRERSSYAQLQSGHHLSNNTYLLTKPTGVLIIRRRNNNERIRYLNFVLL